MLSVSSNYVAAESADVNQPRAKFYLVLGNYAASSLGSSVSASSSDGSGNYPASGAIDGDRTELNVGAASTADNDIGKSSWRSATAPSVTPQTLTIDMGQSRTINRIKLYQLSSHGLSSYKFESSTDNISYTLIAKTTTQGGTITTTDQLDTIDFTDVTCRYVRLTVADTIVAADTANVVEIEIYRLVEISSRVISCSLDRSRDYKLGNPLASTLSLVCSNSDRYFSFSHIPTTAEAAAGFVNTQLLPNIGIIGKFGFAYGGGTPEVVQAFVGYVDSIKINPGGRTATIECRDGMKTCFNQTVSSKLKTSLDLGACVTYALNLANISTWETAVDTTGITEDYFFIQNQSVIAAVQALTQGAGDAVFYFDENGIATFKTFLNNTPLNKIESTEADFEAGTVLTNIDTTSVPNQFGRKWFLVDDFADGDFNNNPVWTNRATPLTVTDDTFADFEAGTVKTNIDDSSTPGTIQRKWFTVDDFADNQYTSNPAWQVRNGNYSNFPPFPANHWSVVTGALKYAPGVGGTSDWFFQGRASIDWTGLAFGTWEAVMEFEGSSFNDGQMEFFFVANTRLVDFGATGQLGNGYSVLLDRLNQQISLNKNSGPTTSLRTVGFALNNLTPYTVRVTRDAITSEFNVYVNGTLVINALDSGTPINTSIYYGFTAQTTEPGSTINAVDHNYYFSGLYYSFATLTPSDAFSTNQAVFESQAHDLTTSVVSLGTFVAAATLPSGTSFIYSVATSPDGITWSAYVNVTNGSPIAMAAQRYVKWKAIFSCPMDSGTSNAVFTTPSIDSVTIQYTTVGWQCIANALKYAPLATNLRVGIDTQFQQATGTWRTNVTMTNGSSAGGKFRLYTLTTGYDLPTNTYLSGYYAEVDQGAGALSIYKINASGTRTLLATTAQAINTSVHSLRLTRTSAGVLNLYWDEVLKVTATDTGFSASQALAFEVDPNGDNNGNVVVDDVVFSPTVDGTGAISSVQSVFESDVIDMTASITALGLFQSNFVTPTGTDIAFYTATSADGVSFDAYVPVTPGDTITSTMHRYIKYKVVLTCPIDNGIKGTVITPVVTDVTINWTIGTGSQKYPSSVSYVFADTGTLLGLEQEITDLVGGDTAILNDISVQAKPLVLSGSNTDVQWQGTVGTPAAPISAGNPLSVTNGQILTYAITLSTAMDTSRMSGASPAAAAITFAGGGAGSWVFSRINPTKPTLVITITGTGTITNLQLQGKPFTNSNTIAAQSATDATSIQKYGDRPLSLSNTYIINSGIAASIATRLLSNYKDALSFVSSCVVRPSFAAQIGDRVTITENNADLSADFIIIGLTHVFAANVANADAKTNLTLLRVIV